jgi:hypothetical protein
MTDAVSVRSCSLFRRDAAFHRDAALSPPTRLLGNVSAEVAAEATARGVEGGTMINSSC